MTEKFQLNTPETVSSAESRKRIIACIGTGASYLDEKEQSQFKTKEDAPNVLFVDFRGDERSFSELNITNHGEQSYMISPLDTEDKRSKEYVNCTGIAGVGKEKASDKSVSFLSHQCPTWFLSDAKNQQIFLDDLDKILSEMKERCDTGTIDVVIFGGNYISGTSMNSEHTRQRYTESIQTLSQKIHDILGFEPVVITEPKPFSGEDDVVLETQTARLFLRRPSKNSVPTDTIRSQSFLPKDLEQKTTEWNKKQAA
ncbi:MAG: hypothetical protein M0P76_03945 [Candidatus Pacebacteria bacterium]|jgi:hypothetical protein|nr:hypothetical protein [Candidatus Paceibacterota bacterium]